MLALIVGSQGVFGEDRDPSSQDHGPRWDVRFAPEGPIKESSGLVPGIEPDTFWTHNDSGGRAVIYKVDGDGDLLQTVVVDGAEANDWEDLASFRIDDTEFLMIGDVGDNLARRPSVMLYVLPMPAPTAKTAKVSLSIEVTYDDGPRDCEAIAVDTKTSQIMLVAKSRLPWSGVYTTPLPRVPTIAPEKASVVRTAAKRQFHITTALVTAIDIDRNNGDVMLANYFQVFHFRRSGSASSVDVLRQIPTLISAPRIKQIEGGCFDHAGTIHLSSEGPRLILAHRSQ